MIRIATLGPADSNHAFVLSRYLEQRGLQDSEVILIDDFLQAFADLEKGYYDYLLQVSAHFSHGDCVGHFMHRVFPVDTFIAASRPLALVARRGVDQPTSVLRQPATRYYTDLRQWQEIDAATTVEALERLRAGQADAAIVAEDALERFSDELICLQRLGAALDTWVLYANRPLSSKPPASRLTLHDNPALQEHFNTVRR